MSLSDAVNKLTLEIVYEALVDLPVILLEVDGTQYLMKVYVQVFGHEKLFPNKANIIIYCWVEILK